MQSILNEAIPFKIEVMFTQEVFLSILAGVIVLLNNYIREGVLVHLSHQKESELIRLIEEIRYSTEDGRNNYRNALVFKKATRRYAPIHIINQIFNCYDPCFAARIYAKAPTYLKFDCTEPEGPCWRTRNLSKFLSWTLFAVGVSLLLLSTFSMLAISTTDGSTASQQSQSVVYISFLVFLLFSMLSIWIFHLAGRELIFLQDVDKFYKYYEEYKLRRLS